MYLAHGFFDAFWNYTEETAEEFGAKCHHCRWCFNGWKDLVIPGFVEASLRTAGGYKDSS